MQALPEKRERLLSSARRVMLDRGYPGTTVDQICAAADVTKGAFFHYFKSKEEVGKAVVERFVSDLVEAFRVAPFRDLDDPLERVYAYVDFTSEVCRDAILKDGCILGLFSQEVAATKPDFGEICRRSFRGWASDLKSLLELAKAARAPDADIDTESLAEQFIALVEGTLILRRAYAEPAVVNRALKHFQNYLTLLFEGQSSVERGRDDESTCTRTRRDPRSSSR